MSEYLDRKQVIELYEKYQPSLATHVYEFGEKLRSLPVTQDSHGEWKPLGEPDDLGIHSWHICSSCGFRTTWHMVDIFHFCPNCGSDNRKCGEAE